MRCATLDAGIIAHTTGALHRHPGITFELQSLVKLDKAWLLIGPSALINMGQADLSAFISSSLRLKPREHAASCFIMKQCYG